MKELGIGKPCSATVQILELPALVGILEEVAGLAPLARGCALGGASSHIPAGDFPRCLLLRHTRGGRAVPRGCAAGTQRSSQL